MLQARLHEDCSSDSGSDSSLSGSEEFLEVKSNAPQQQYPTSLAKASGYSAEDYWDRYAPTKSYSRGLNVSSSPSNQTQTKQSRRQSFHKYQQRKTSSRRQRPKNSKQRTPSSQKKKGHRSISSSPHLLSGDSFSTPYRIGLSFLHPLSSKKHIETNAGHSRIPLEKTLFSSKPTQRARSGDGSKEGEGNNKDERLRNNMLDSLMFASPQKYTYFQEYRHLYFKHDVTAKLKEDVLSEWRVKDSVCDFSRLFFSPQLCVKKQNSKKHR